MFFRCAGLVASGLFVLEDMSKRHGRLYVLRCLSVLIVRDGLEGTFLAWPISLSRYLGLVILWYFNMKPFGGCHVMDMYIFISFRHAIDVTCC